MGLLSRFSTYVKSVMSSSLDKAEDPGMTMDYAYEQQLEQLQNLRRSIADVVTNEKRLELQEAQVQAQMDKLDSQAQEAMSANREDLARQALTRKQQLQQYIATYNQQIEQLKAQQDKFVDLEQRLGARVEAFRTQKEMVKAQYGAAQAQVQIQESATGISEEMSDVNLSMQRAQDKVQQMQGRAEAMDSLIQSGTLQEVGPGAQDELDSQLSAISDNAEVDKQLAQLKAQLPSAGATPPQLPPAAGGGGSSAAPTAQAQTESNGQHQS
ncbi:MAG: PspA/IM30 family protein [Ktedonobacterales bacterium]